MKFKIEVPKGEKNSLVVALTQRSTGGDLQNQSVDPGKDLDLEVDDETRVTFSQGAAFAPPETEDKAGDNE